MKRDTTVSVIVPSHNYGRFLKDCVESILAQTEVDLRVLIVDDASTDNSVEVAEALAAADSRIELRVHPVNRGHIDTYNEGVSWVSGTYTVVLDSDDMLAGGSLRRSCDLLEAHPEAGIVYGRARRFYGESRPGRANTGRPIWRIWRGREWFESRCRITENCVAQPTVVMRTSVARKVGSFRHELPHTADMEMWIRMSLFADVGYIGGSQQAFYRVHSAGMHRSKFGTKLADLRQVAAAFESLFREYRDMIADHALLERSVRETLARRALDAACRIYDRGQSDLTDVAGLEELALATCDRANELDEWKHLRWRKSIGPTACMALRPFLLFTSASRSWQKVKRYQLHRMGLL